MVDDKKTESEADKEIPLRHIVPEDLPMIFSDQLVVRHQSGVFLLMFFQNRHPITLTPADLRKVERIDSRCVAQIVLTPDEMEKNIVAMTQNLKKFHEKKRASIQKPETE